MYADAFDENEHVALCEAIDRILNKGAVIVGEATISVANVDLIYLALQIMLSSVETAGHIRKDAFPPHKQASKTFDASPLDGER